MLLLILYRSRVCLIKTQLLLFLISLIVVLQSFPLFLLDFRLGFCDSVDVLVLDAMHHVQRCPIEDL